MTPRISTALGVVAGLVLSLSVALVVVVAGNGTNNPGVMRVSGESAAGGASAPLSQPASPAHSSFDGLDVDGDGKLSLAEAAGYGDIVTRFHRVDRNKDGKLTKAELASDHLPVKAIIALHAQRQELPQRLREAAA